MPVLGSLELHFGYISTLPQKIMNVSLFLSFHQGELQRSCLQSAAEELGHHCQLACQCRGNPPFPPPPPPPPPPRLMVATGNIPAHLSLSPISLTAQSPVFICLVTLTHYRITETRSGHAECQPQMEDSSNNSLK